MLPFYLISIIILVAVPIVVIKFFRKVERRPAPVVEEQFLDEQASEPSPDGPVVRFRFHTYRGFLSHFVQTKHELKLPFAQARETLWRLHKENLKWGWLIGPIVLVPMLSYFEYRSQVRSVERQAAEAMSGWPIE
jgi:hypothetical protein